MLSEGPLLQVGTAGWLPVSVFTMLSVVVWVDWHSAGVLRQISPTFLAVTLGNDPDRLRLARDRHW